MNFQAPEGTYDILPSVVGDAKDPDSNRRQVLLWRRVEEAARSCFARYGYEEIRPSLLEKESVFYKATGEVTDIVEKEMFTFPAWVEFADQISRILYTREFVLRLDSVEPGRELTTEEEQTKKRQHAILFAFRELRKQKRAGPVKGAPFLQSLKESPIESVSEFWRSVPADKAEAVTRAFTEETFDGLTLRPELTPGAIRALIEGGLFAKKNFWKVWYFGPAFRKERPQKGRYRSFTQIGVEAVGSADPLVDAETIILLSEILNAVGVKTWDLRINSIGCTDCRPAYREVLKAAVLPILPSLDENCKRRFERNVFRILDCKVDAEKTKDLPRSIDHLCQKCKDHMAVVEGALRACEVPYRVDPRIVRGLDYYTRTVYEFSSSKLGAQDALAGGGRYDTLVGSMGGPDVGSVGFAAGVERILLAMEGEAVPPVPDFFAVAVADVSRSDVFRTVVQLRRQGLSGDLDFEARSVKAQMRSANKSGARYAVFIGPEEVQKGVLKIKDMKDGSEKTAVIEEAVKMLQRGTP
ncbi:MAG TPA: histidine--tRNA ligase [Planctomycetota bacterium]|nr:histidine--tRNA ligase [Planctomycetota bacterium]